MRSVMRSFKRGENFWRRYGIGDRDRPDGDSAHRCHSGMAAQARLLLTAMSVFAVAHTVTALSSKYPLTPAARFVAGASAGLAWALLAGYA